MKNVTLLCLCLSAAVACGCAGNASRKKAAETASPDTLPATMATGLGDSLAAVPGEAIRDTLHRPYTEKELDELQKRIWKRLEELKETPIGRNVYMSSVMADGRLEVALMLNSPEMREEFRRLVADVPVIRLTGPTEPQLDDRVGSDDTLGLYLCPNGTSLPFRTSGARGDDCPPAGYSTTWATHSRIMETLPLPPRSIRR